jgi:hypothetical protein
MGIPMAFIFAGMLCLTSGRQAHAQAASPVSSVHPAVLNADALDAVVLRVVERARLQGRGLGASTSVFQGQSPTGAARHRAVKWGALIGAVAGGAGGALQPTHSNGEYVLGHNRLTSALALSGISAGIGALVGVAIEKSRK